MSTIRKAYQVRPVEKRMMTELVAQFDKAGKYTGFVEKQREVKNGFMVFFPRGHSIYVESESELARLKLNGEGGLVDMATGEPVTKEQIAATADEQDLEKHVARVNRARGSGIDGTLDALE